LDLGQFFWLGQHRSTLHTDPSRARSFQLCLLLDLVSLGGESRRCIAQFVFDARFLRDLRSARRTGSRQGFRAAGSHLAPTERCKFCNLCGKFRLLVFFVLLFHFPLYEQQTFHRDMKLNIGPRFVLSRTKTGHSNPHNGAVETCTCRSCQACANKFRSHGVAIRDRFGPSVLTLQNAAKNCPYHARRLRTIHHLPSVIFAFSEVSHQTARAWPEGVEDDQHSSSQETKSDKEIESIVSGSNQPQIPEATFSSILKDQSQISSYDSESSSDSGSLPEPSATELHDGNSPKRLKVIIFDCHSI
jgi:hypothetical protein